VDAQVTTSLQKGARIHFQKDMAHLQKTYPRGAWYPPTILSHVSPGMPAYDEEIFGPVYSVILISSDEEAIQVANATRFGLGANIWTKDIKKAEEIASRLITGSVAINDIVKSDPRYPLGGTKASGYGRELGKEGIREWVTAKSVVVA
jgi:succinate-semialdehyde dehydrogenase/glutarate-semialdehyde dehydrogenase